MLARDRRTWYFKGSQDREYDGRLTVVATETRSERTTRPGAIGATITEILGREVPVRIDAYDGSSVGPSDAGTRLVVRSPDAFRYMVTAPGELGFARA